MCLFLPYDLHHLTSISVWINLPIAAVAWLLLLISLKDIPLRRPSGISWKNLYEKFDIIGLYVTFLLYKSSWTDERILESASWPERSDLFSDSVSPLNLDVSCVDKIECAMMWRLMISFRVFSGDNCTIGRGFLGFDPRLHLRETHQEGCALPPSHVYKSYSW